MRTDVHGLPLAQIAKLLIAGKPHQLWSDYFKRAEWTPFGH